MFRKRNDRRTVHGKGYEGSPVTDTTFKRTISFHERSVARAEHLVIVLRRIRKPPFSISRFYALAGRILSMSNCARKTAWVVSEWSYCTLLVAVQNGRFWFQFPESVSTCSNERKRAALGNLPFESLIRRKIRNGTIRRKSFNFANENEENSALYTSDESVSLKRFSSFSVFRK